MTKDEAKAKAETLNTIGPTSWCPLAREMCRQSCYCYKLAEVKSHKSKHTYQETYTVVPPHCANALVNSDMFNHWSK